MVILIPRYNNLKNLGINEIKSEQSKKCQKKRASEIRVRIETQSKLSAIAVRTQHSISKNYPNYFRVKKMSEKTRKSWKMVFLNSSLNRTSVKSERDSRSHAKSKIKGQPTQSSKQQKERKIPHSIESTLNRVHFSKLIPILNKCRENLAKMILKKWDFPNLSPKRKAVRLSEMAASTLDSISKLYKH